MTDTVDVVIAVDSYEYRQGTREDPQFTPYGKGDVASLPKPEAERLLSLGAAERPGEREKREAERLEAQAAELRQRQEELEERARAAQEKARDVRSGDSGASAGDEDDLESLTVPQLEERIDEVNAEREQRGLEPLPRSGDKPDLIARLREQG